MTKILINLFVLRKNLDIVNTRKKYGELSSFVGIILNFLLSAIKISVGYIFGSISVLGDGVNNLSDATSSVITLIGFKYSSKPADKKHPFGHERMEYVAGLIVSFIIMMIGLELFKASFQKVFLHEKLVFDIIIVISLVISIAIKLWLYLFNDKIAKEIHSQTIEATAKDSLNDVFVSCGVLVSLIFYKLTNINIDAYVGIFLAFVIIFAGINLVKETLSPLLGEAPDHELIKDVYKRLRSYKEVIDIHDLIIHSYGYHKYFASVHVEVSENTNIVDAHELADDIERDFKETGIQLVVHIDPTQSGSPEVLEYREFVKGVLKEINPTISMHDFRVVTGSNHSNLVFDIVLPCEVGIKEKDIKEMIEQKVHGKYEKIYTVIEIDKHYNGL